MKLGTMDHALICSGPMSTFSYDSHPMSRGRMVDELPRVQQDNKTDRYKLPTIIPMNKIIPIPATMPSKWTWRYRGLPGSCTKPSVG